MFRNGRNNRCKSVNMTKSRDNKLHVVELTLSDVGPLNISPPAKFETYIRQQENWPRPGTEGPGEILIDEDVRTMPHYPSDNALNDGEGEIYDGHSHSANILNNQRKSNRNSRYQVAPETDNGNRPVRPYRPISSHQYLTSTELKDSTINEKNVHLGRPTRTTLLRERQRRRSVPAVDMSHNLQQQRGGQKLDPRIPTRYEAVKTILSSMIPPGQSLHSFISGARYNRSNWIETIGSVDLASDLPAMGVGGSSLNPPHQKHQKPVSEQQLDVDYTPRAPPESPVDFSNTTVRDGTTGAFLPVLSAGGPGSVAEPSSPLPPPKQVPDSNRSRKIAWEEEIKRLSPLPDRAASTQEKVRFQTEEPVTGGNVHAVHHERTHHAVRPSSVRAPTTQVVKPGRDMAAVVIHGISLHGAPTAREATSYQHALADQPNPDGMRRSWSATTYTASGARPPPQVEFNRLDSLKVTGIKVSGSTPDSGRVGLRLSALKPWRLENDAESTEALVGSRCEVFSDRGTGVVAAQDAAAAAAVAGRRSDAGNDENDDRELNFNDDDGVDHEVDSVEDVHRENNFSKDVEDGSCKDVDHEIDSNEDVDHEIKSDEDIAHHEIESNEDINHEIRSNEGISHEIECNKVVDFNIYSGDFIVSKGNKDRSTDSKTIEGNQGKQPPSRLDLRRLSPDQLRDRDDLDSVSSKEQGPVKLEKPNQVNLPDESGGYNDTASETGRVSVDDMFEELGQVGTRDLASAEGQNEPPELGRVSVLDDESWKEAVASDDGGHGKNSGYERKNAEDGVVFFITEDQLNDAEKFDSGSHEQRAANDGKRWEMVENNEAKDEEWEFNSDSARNDAVNDISDAGITEDVDIMVSDRSAISPEGDTTEPAGHRSVGRRN